MDLRIKFCVLNMKLIMVREIYFRYREYIYILYILGIVDEINYYI